MKLEGHSYSVWHLGWERKLNLLQHVHSEGILWKPLMCIECFRVPQTCRGLKQRKWQTGHSRSSYIIWMWYLYYVVEINIQYMVLNTKFHPSYVLVRVTLWHLIRTLLWNITELKIPFFNQTKGSFVWKRETEKILKSWVSPSPSSLYLAVGIDDRAKEFPGAPATVHPDHSQDLQEPETPDGRGGKHVPLRAGGQHRDGGDQHHNVWNRDGQVNHFQSRSRHRHC